MSFKIGHLVLFPTDQFLRLISWLIALYSHTHTTGCRLPEKVYITIATETQSSESRARVFHINKPSSLTSHMVNLLPWYKRITAVFVWSGQ